MWDDVDAVCLLYFLYVGGYLSVHGLYGRCFILCVCVCVRVFVFPTSKGDRGILVESDQRRVQQHRVHVLCDHTVVGRLDPRLVLVDCERDKTTYISPSFLFL